MRNFTVSILMIFWITCFSQDPDPQLFQTWYLNTVQGSDLSTAYNVPDIEPEITPTLTISDTFNFSGEGACNSFGGIFSITGADIMTSQFFSTDAECVPELHNWFEDSYFSFLQGGGWYTIEPDASGLVLTISNPIMGYAIFRNYLLGTTDFEINQITIYPNPGSTGIYINDELSTISNIQLINSFGQIVRVITDSFEFIEISNLPSGMYIVKISNTLGTVNKKFIKV